MRVTIEGHSLDLEPAPYNLDHHFAALVVDWSREGIAADRLDPHRQAGQTVANNDTAGSRPQPPILVIDVTD
ncbi:MAG: hypothetical protein R3C46_03900 [Hyphomonadaceae bacterium]